MDDLPIVDMRKLGERVFFLRRRAGLSQGRLAQAAGLDAMTISRLERGVTKRLQVEQLARLARNFHVPADYLLGATWHTLRELPDVTP